MNIYKNFVLPPPLSEGDRNKLAKILINIKYYPNYDLTGGKSFG